MSSRLLALVASLLALAGTLSACGEGSAPRPSSSAATAASGATDAIAAIGARLEPDGSIGKDLALDLFSTLVGPLPGWTPGTAIPTEGLPSGSIAVRAVLGHLDELTADQRKAVQDRVHYLHAAAAPRSPAHSLAGPVTLHTRIDDVLQQEIDFAVEALSARLGRSLPAPITYVRLDPAHYGAAAGEQARTNSWSTPDQFPRLLGCEITFRTSIDALARNEIREIVAHEVYHCFQSAQFPADITATSHHPAWLVEGQAAWVGETLSGGGPVARRWWLHWLTEPGTDLLARSYDAIGYYATMQAAGVDVWHQLDAMMREPAAAYSRTATAAVRRQWATRLVREPSFGAQWESVGPAITADRARITRTTLAAGAASADDPSMPRATRSAGLLAVESPADAVRLVPGADTVGAIHTATGTDLSVDGRPVLLCLRADHCRCPDGRARGVQPYLDAGPGPFTVALQGDTGAHLEIVNQVVDATCPTAAPTSGALDPALVGTWVSDRWTTPPVMGTATGGAGMTLTLGADAALDADFDPMRPVTISNSGVITHFRYSGTSDGTWSAHDHELRLDYARPHALRVSIAIPSAGFNYDRDFAAAASGSIGPLTRVTYSVAGDTLRMTMTVPRGLGDLVIRFHRR